MKKLVMVSFLLAVLLIAGCQEYLNKDAVGGNFGEDDFCVVNPYDERCQFDWGPQVLGDGSGEDFLKRANYEAELMRNAEYAAAREQKKDDGKLTRDDIREINVLIGLPADAGASERAAWYAEWAVKEDAKFAAAIQKGLVEQVAAAYDARIAELEAGTKLAAGEGAGASVVQAFDNAAKADSLRVEKERAIASVNAMNEWKNFESAARTAKEFQWMKENGKPVNIAFTDAKGDKVNIGVIDVGGKGIFVYDTKTQSFVAVDGNKYRLAEGRLSGGSWSSTEETHVDPTTGKRVTDLSAISVSDIAQVKSDAQVIQKYMIDNNLGNAITFKADGSNYLVKVLPGTSTLQPGGMLIQKDDASLLMGQGRGVMNGMFAMSDIGNRGLAGEAYRALGAAVTNDAVMKYSSPATTTVDSLFDSPGGQTPAPTQQGTGSTNFDDLFGPGK